MTSKLKIIPSVLFESSTRQRLYVGSIVKHATEGQMTIVALKDVPPREVVLQNSLGVLSVKAQEIGAVWKPESRNPQYSVKIDHTGRVEGFRIFGINEDVPLTAYQEPKMNQHGLYHIESKSFVGIGAVINTSTWGNVYITAIEPPATRDTDASVSIKFASGRAAALAPAQVGCRWVHDPDAARETKAMEPLLLHAVSITLLVSARNQYEITGILEETKGLLTHESIVAVESDTTGLCLNITKEQYNESL